LWGFLDFSKVMGEYGCIYGYIKGKSMLNPSINITKKILNQIARIDEFKGEWKAIQGMSRKLQDMQM
jgi:hypothetical protein